MRNAEMKCRFTDRCVRVWPDNDGGCWCNQDGYCVDGKVKERAKYGNEVKIYESLIQRCGKASKVFDY